MAKLDNNSTGFSILEALLILVILGIVGFTGWYVWNANQTTNQTYNSAAKTAAATAPSRKKSAKSASQNANQNQTFLTIKELGIKLPLTSPIKDLIYTYNTTAGGSSTTTNYLHFSTTSISSIPNSTVTCSADQDPLGTYTVYSTPQSIVGAADNQAGILAATVNGHYIYYHHVQYGCGDSPQNIAKVQVLIAPLLTAVQQAQAN